MARNDPYQILGVQPSADQGEIRRAYRRLAKQFHPDRNPGDRHSENRFKEVSSAYEILRDPKKRAEFDRRGFGPATTHTAGPSPFESRSGFSDIFEQFFSDLFQGPKADLGQRAERGKDLKYHMAVTLEDIVGGAMKPLQITRLETCDQCRGIGTGTRSRPQACVVCGGSGYVRRRHGLLDFKVPCRTCSGKGEVILDACERCGGKGRIRKERTLNVRIPPGAEEGMRMKIGGEGDSGVRGGGPGDLLVTLGLQPHAFFRREETDVHFPLTVSMVDAALGSTLEVPTLNGPVSMKLPAGTQSGSTFRLRGKGLPRPDGADTGDQLVHIRVATPTRMNRKQWELLRQFSQLGNGPERSPDVSKRPRSLSISGLSGRLKQWLRGSRGGKR